MSSLFSYRDEFLYSHHSLDPVPESDGFTMHAHEWMEILYFISGKGSYLVEGTVYPLQPQDILILRSAETHTLNISSEEPYERIAIHFSPDLLNSIDPEHRLLRPFLNRPLGHLNHYPISADATGQLRTPFQQFEFPEGTDVRLNLLGRLLLFLTALDREFEGKQVISTQGFPSQLVAYVNEHLFEPISLQSIADHFYRSRSQISRTFHQATGSSLWDYVLIKRLLSARAMIQRGETAGNACIRCGFSDYSSFYRAYRAQFGHAPKEDAPQTNAK